MKVLVGSVNPVKIAAVGEVFERYFSEVEVVGVAVESGVPAQPVGDETFAGAENRALALVARNAAEGLDAIYCAGLEGGVAQLHGRWFAFGVLCIADAAGRLGFGLSPLFEMPPVMVADVLTGVELGHVVDRLSGEQNTKQRGGAIAFLTRGRVDRRMLYAQGLAMALVPFLNEEMYFDA